MWAGLGWEGPGRRLPGASRESSRLPEASTAERPQQQDPEWGRPGPSVAGRGRVGGWGSGSASRGSRVHADLSSFASWLLLPGSVFVKLVTEFSHSVWEKLRKASWLTGTPARR